MSIRRHGIREKQWDKSKLDNMQGVPWEPVPGREGTEIKSNVSIPTREDMPQKVIEPGQREIIMRRAKITKEDVMKFGLTPGCPGCEAANRSGVRRDHSEECRNGWKDL